MSKTKEIAGWTANSHFSRNQPACSSWIALVKPIHVHLFNFLVILVSDEDYNQDKILKCILRTFTRNFSNIDFFLKILPLKDDELAMPEI